MFKVGQKVFGIRSGVEVIVTGPGADETRFSGYCVDCPDESQSDEWVIVAFNAVDDTADAMPLAEAIETIERAGFPCDHEGNAFFAACTGDGIAFIRNGFVSRRAVMAFATWTDI